MTRLRSPSATMRTAWMPRNRTRPSTRRVMAAIMTRPAARRYPRRHASFRRISRMDTTPASAKRYCWEDLPVGLVMALGSTPVAREETLAFARRFDPQPFHLDDAAAEA